MKLNDMPVTRRTVLAGVGLACTVPLMGGCSGSSDPTPPVGGALLKTAPKDAAAWGDVAAACERLGLAALAASTSTEVFSPSSAALALGMLARGASGVAKTELETLLGASDDRLAKAMNAMLTTLAAFDGDPAGVKAAKLPDTPLVHVANNAVVAKGSQVNQDYLDALRSYYDSGVTEADLAKDSSVLDAWVKKHSGGLIEKSAIEPNPDLVLVLQSAVVFAAKWKQVFGDAFEGEFTNADGSQSKVKLMTAALAAPVAQTDGWTALRLPYTAGFGALFVLPPAGVRLATITSDQLKALRAKLASQQLSVAMPLLSVKSTFDLAPVLRAQSAGSVLEDSAKPLERISAGKGLFLGQAKQQAVLDLGSEGTRAAAVTELGVVKSSAPSGLRIVFDRPYFVSVEHDDTALPLFQVAVNRL